MVKSSGSFFALLGTAHAEVAREIDPWCQTNLSRTYGIACSIYIFFISVGLGLAPVKVVDIRLDYKDSPHPVVREGKGKGLKRHYG